LQQRIKEYSTKPTETLNDDQKRFLQTLPTLEASARELEDVRKAIEVRILASQSALSKLTRYFSYTKRNRPQKTPVVSPKSKRS
jgi:hypothetical protein